MKNQIDENISPMAHQDLPVRHLGACFLDGMFARQDRMAAYENGGSYEYNEETIKDDREIQRYETQFGDAKGQATFTPGSVFEKK